MEKQTLAEKIGYPNAKRKEPASKVSGSSPWYSALKRALTPDPAKAQADAPKETKGETLAERINWAGKHSK